LLENKVIAPFCYKGTCDQALVNFWLEQFLLPALGPGYTLVMDNAAFHKTEKTRLIVDKAQCKILFLPPYSPDLNPIEKLWARLKNIISKSISQFHSLEEAIDYAFRAII
jgi:transposase